MRTSYDGDAKRLIYDFKFDRKQAAGRQLGYLTAECLPYLSDVVVTHIPTANRRVRQRGYDHARLLARELARAKSMQHATLLIRHGKSRQVGASREQRLRQLDDAFSVAKPNLVRGASILLVDDIVTTGATLEAAARCLKQAGARQVDAVVFAQKEL